MSNVSLNKEDNKEQKQSIWSEIRWTGFAFMIYGMFRFFSGI